MTIAVVLGVAVGLLALWALRLHFDLCDVRDKIKFAEFPVGAKWGLLDSFPKAYRMATEDDLHALARALGYEWKRTEAKEGWEKKDVVITGTVGRGAPVWGCIPPFSYTAVTPVTDRRKSDRRKPLYTAHDVRLYSANLGASKPTKKKPTRTAAQRGPQRRAH